MEVVFSEDKGGARGHTQAKTILEISVVTGRARVNLIQKVNAIIGRAPSGLIALVKVAFHTAAFVSVVAAAG